MKHKDTKTQRHKERQRSFDRVFRGSAKILRRGYSPPGTGGEYPRYAAMFLCAFVSLCFLAIHPSWLMAQLPAAAPSAVGMSSTQLAHIRDAVEKAEVEVIRFRIIARGRVHEERGKQFFVAGKDKFLLPASPKIPSDGTISIEGTVDDSADPLQLKVLRFKLLK